ncbi:hypothetical protein FRACYDRAFT_254536 [Fragilariopsis cylindrus CCMP1102]|uniref:Uncharacterized protein n=1 Tax=Fragilariopsis cylindrus CCMP1102 TaxID=635003 RepID=A0A1E7EKV1_9STRA|nr:hypothetical protein FRACYDRAFT_254536 [Fragilariopsis cylindrus CCMP1102]|eukprot:OEU06516.1 hypothetical protein FRACYDRAFT_254536 [Fragilariopsis cylindrus CCMP1102]
MMKSLIASFSLFVLSPSLATAGFTTNVCFTINDSPVVGALVKCWDDDYGSDDRVGPSGGARTDSNGCVSLYDSQSWLESPDVFCRIDPNGDCFAEATTSTKSNHNKRRDANFGTVALQYDEDYCGDFGLDTNGCGTSRIPSFLRDTLTETLGFENQCNAHDICYADCSKKGSDCDDDFYDDMLSTCAGQVNCELLAYFFFTALDTFGYEACDNSRRNDCDQAGLDRCNDESCDLVDDEMFRKKNKSCRKWVGNKKGKKMKKKCKKKHKKKKVFVWCPVTCGEKAGLGKCAFIKKKKKNKNKNNNKNKKKKN